MAGSFNHIVDDDGKFTMDTIENLGDAHEALEDCYRIIYTLADGDTKKISNVCDEIETVNPWDISYDDKSDMKI